MKHHICPRLGAMRLDRIRPAHIQGVLNSIERAPRTVQQARAVLSKSLRQAVAWGLIPTSPVPATQAPKAERPELSIPTIEDIQTLLRASHGTRWEVPLILAAYTGARRGEILAVGWDSVDLERERVSITRSLENVGGEFRFKEPKTTRSRREIALPPAVVSRIRRHRAEQGERRLAAGVVWRDLGLVCDRGDGGPIVPDAFSKAFKRLARQVGIPDARLHDLRHAAATTMMEQGVHPLAVSKALGHASEAFTMTVYGHASDEMLDQAADALGRAYGAL